MVTQPLPWVDCSVLDNPFRFFFSPDTYFKRLLLLRLFLLVLSLASWEKRLTPTLLNIHFRWCREWHGPHWAVASPDTSPALSFSGLALAPWCLSCSQGPKLNRGFKVWPHQSWEQRREWSLPSSHWPHLLIQTRMSLAFLAMWAHTGSHSASADQHSQILFCQTAIQPLCPQPVVLLEVVVTQTEDFSLALLNLLQLA